MAKGAKEVAAAGAIGTAAGAVAVGMFAFLTRAPETLISDDISTVTRVLGVSLAALVVAAGVLVYLVVAALRGKPKPVAAVWLTAATTAAAIYFYVSSAVDVAAVVLSGPDIPPVLAMAQLSWVLTVLASLLTLAAAVYPSATPGRRVVAISAAAGLAIALTAAAVVSVGARDATRPTAAPIDIPPLPTSVGTEVAYSLATYNASLVLAAGPGFVMTDLHNLTAYDGSTGTPRWSFPFDDLPERCTPTGLWSTGIEADAVVIIECFRPPAAEIAEHADADPVDVFPNRQFFPPDYQDYGAVHIALDAMTGQLLWTAERDLWLQPRVDGSGAALMVVGPDRFGVLDPRTGALRWTAPRLDNDENCADYTWYVATDTHVVAATRCADEFELRLYDGADGTEHTVDLPAEGVTTAGFERAEVAAISKDYVVVQFRGRDPENGSAPDLLMTIDTGDGRVQTTSVTGYELAESSLLYDQPAGPVLAIRDDDALPAYSTELMIVATGKSLQLTGFRAMDDPVPSRLRWALVGDQLVTAGMYEKDVDVPLAAVAPDGAVTTYPSPCGADTGGVLTVPGALLVMCPNTQGDYVVGYDIYALR